MISRTYKIRAGMGSQCIHKQVDNSFINSLLITHKAGTRTQGQGQV